MSPRPKPLVGALLGLALGVIVSALLWILGVTPPDRLPLFGILAVSTLVGSTLTTLAFRRAAGRYLAVVVLCAVAAGVALTGIPEFTGNGDLSEGCHVSATSSLETEPVTPEGTSPTDPFDMTQTDTVAWTATTDGELVEASPSVALMIGGFAVPLWNGQTAYDGVLDLAGEDSVAEREDVVRDAVGITLTGTYHLAGQLDGAMGGCTADAYLRVASDGAFGGLLPVLLWILLAVVVVGIAVVSGAVARSIRQARRAQPLTDTLTTTGGTSRVVPTSGSLAAVPEQSTGEPPASRSRREAAAGVADARRDSPREASSSRDKGDGGGSSTSGRDTGSGKAGRRDGASRDAVTSRGDGGGIENRAEQSDAVAADEAPDERQHDDVAEPPVAETVPVFIDRDDEPHEVPEEPSTEAPVDPDGEPDDDTRETRRVEGDRDA
ncbi:hypothetical protein [Demequina sp. NBRC 110057]|uniref:hypothetical protein n=1 Tax=Demequina sp. NBRC 110057 TaxID=1570346 RepID=UPI001178562C|nr:hypothetical protein [Demequina sp. NBRC 110057]